ncbi:MAG: hypothetical protein IJT88_07210 [Kiritimatiellae bacterium]|nr:hypothetical protein [Kiritimatiellia bacterium]
MPDEPGALPEIERLGQTFLHGAPQAIPDRPGPRRVRRFDPQPGAH